MPAAKSKMIPETIHGVKKLKPPVKSDRAEATTRAAVPIAMSMRFMTLPSTDENNDTARSS